MKAIAFIDYENIWQGLHEVGCRVTPDEFIRLLEDYADFIEVDLRAIYLYANFDKEEFWRTQTAFEKKNIFTRHIYGKNNYVHTELRRNAADTELMLEVQEILLARPTSVDIFLLFTGDGDFLPIIRRIRAWGKDVKIIGLKNKTHHLLLPYSEGFDVFCSLLQNFSSKYNPQEDQKEAIRCLAELQEKLSYVGSTRARVYLSEKLGRTMAEVKELVRYLLLERLLLEKEYPDPNLMIKKTKIYLLNLEHPGIREILQKSLASLSDRYSLLQGAVNVPDNHS